MREMLQRQTQLHEEEKQRQQTRERENQDADEARRRELAAFEELHARQRQRKMQQQQQTEQTSDLAAAADRADFRLADTVAAAEVDGIGLPWVGGRGRYIILVGAMLALGASTVFNASGGWA